MSIDFVTSRRDIPFAELLPRLAPYDITCSRSEPSSSSSMFLIDKETGGGVWVCAGEDGMLSSLTWYTYNGVPRDIFGAIIEVFDTQIAVYDDLFKIDVDLAGEPWRGA